MTTLSNSKSFSINISKNARISGALFTRFLAWCDTTEPVRFAILASIVAMQGCLIIPLTLLLSFYYTIGLGDITFLAVSITTTAVMVTNMALSSMRIVIITFLLNLLINLTLIALHLPLLFK